MENLDPSADDATGEVLPPVFRTAYGPHLSPGVDCSLEPSRTKQEFRDICDINKIVARFMRTGDASLLQRAQGQYLDLTQMPGSYQESLNLVRRSDELFESFPSDVRKIFSNSPDLWRQEVDKDPAGFFTWLQARSGTRVATPPSGAAAAAPSGSVREPQTSTPEKGSNT